MKNRIIAISVSILMVGSMLFGCASQDKTKDIVITSFNDEKETVNHNETETTSKNEDIETTSDSYTSETTNTSEERTSNKVDETISEIETTTKNIEQATTKKKTEQTTTKKQNTTQSTTASKNEEDYVYEDGILWPYRSQLYDDNTLKGKMEDIFWDEYGWTMLGKEKCDEMVRASVELAYEILNTYSTEFEKERALHDSILKICNYDYEAYNNGTWDWIEGSPYGTLVEGKAVCGGYACTFMICCKMMGIDCLYVSGWSKNGETHGWNQVCIEGDWYEVDCTWDDNISDEGMNYNSYAYFNLTTDEMAVSHIHSGYNEKCTGMKYGKEYMDKLLKAEFKAEYLKDKFVINTRDEALKYINKALNSGETQIEVIFSSVDVKNDILDLIKPDYWEEGKRYKIYNISKDSEQYYFDFDTVWDYGDGVQYKLCILDGIYRFDLDVTYLNDYRSMENYFETYEQFYTYAREQKEKGVSEVIGYLAFTEDDIYETPLDSSQFGEEFYMSSYRTFCDSYNLVKYTVYFAQ